MLTAILRRCFNPFGGLSPPVKTGVRVSHPVLGDGPIPLRKNALERSVLYPSPPHREEQKMTLRYAHSLSLLLALLLAVAPPVAAQNIVDYDQNDNSLIDVSTLAQLNAMRHDLNGNGDATHADYVAAFSNRDTATATRMGCPSGTCTGYELMNDLTFPSSGAYSSWTPIGGSWNTTFDGNNHTLTNLTSTGAGDKGLFNDMAASGVIRNLGLINPTVTVSSALAEGGALAATTRRNAVISSCYVSGGTISGTGTSLSAGGLVGEHRGIIRASYSTATVQRTSGLTSTYGGLVAILAGRGEIHASYVAGPVPSPPHGHTVGGLMGRRDGSNSSITNSYFDTDITTQTNGIGMDGGSPLASAPGYTTAQLQNPTGYYGIYANWNIDLNSDSSLDFPWKFGTSSQHPTLYSPAERSAFPPGNNDYDANDNGLIDISNLAQLDAMRSDLDGDGDPSNASNYALGFPGRDTTSATLMGCPSGTCTGYELTTDLTFASGAIWTPTDTYNTTFDGGGHTITNLSVSTGASDAGMFSQFGSSAVVRDLGLVNPSIAHTGSTAGSNGALVGYMPSGGSIRSVYVEGGSVTTAVNGSNVGGLVGYLVSGNIRASYSTATVGVSGSPTTVDAGGLVGEWDAGGIIASYAAGEVSGGANNGGLVGDAGTGTTGITNSYCDITATMQTSCIGTGTITAAGYTTTQLQYSTGYEGLYREWNIDLDGDSNADFPWKFGTSSEYPMLNTPAERSALRSASIPGNTDYDVDNDNLIDISNLAQLDAIRYDLDGNGDPSNAYYGVAFPGRDTTTAGRMGCPSGTCTGYELTTDLTFPSSGRFSSWTPMDGFLDGIFDGKGYTLTNLNINYNITISGLFRDIGGTGVVRNLGLVNPIVTSITARTDAGMNVGALAGRLNSGGRVETSYVRGGRITGGAPYQVFFVGGLIGNCQGGATIQSTYSSAVSEGSGAAAGRIGGLIGGSACNLIDSYAYGPVRRSDNNDNRGGLIGTTSAGYSITNSYCDTEASGFPCTGNSNSPAALQKTTAELQDPTDYTGIYLNWNRNDPWDFGTSSQYPVLKIDKDGDGTATWQEFGAQRLILAQVSGVQVTPGEARATLVVSWTAAANATGYKVQWKSGDENYDAADRQAVVTDGATTTYTIPNLIAGTEYTVRVIATRTDVDDGSPSDEVTGTPGGDGTPLPEPEPDTDPVFIEAVDPQTYRQNKAIELTLPAAIDGEGTVTYTLTELPDGLTFDAETRIISGTPTMVTEKAIYTVTATDEDGDSGEMSFFITVVANVAPSFGDASVDAQSYLRKQAIESLTLPQATSGDGTLTYALTPDLPTGLSFDAETRMLSGTPLEAMGETTYTLTATDGDGEEATLMFTLSVMADPMPAFGDTTTAIAARGYQNQTIDPLTLPQASGGDEPLTYALMPDLPEGLTFNAETRIVSGTPLKAMDETTYTLIATDGNGDTVTLMFTLEIPDLMPTFGDTTIVAQRYFVNQRIESLALPQATGGDGTLAYILLPFLPDGLSFDMDTRSISGTPTEAIAEATYTFSALDADGDVASLSFTLEVSLPSPDIDGDGNVNFADFLTFAGKYGSRRGQDRYDARCDLNGDGQIDFADFLIFAADFGSTG